MPPLRPGTLPQGLCPFKDPRNGILFPQSLWITPPFPVDNLSSLGITRDLHDGR
jgi:hypothetical protein